MFDLVPRRYRSTSVYNPFREMERLFSNTGFTAPFGEFRTDIKDNTDSYLIEAELPGFKKEDINIDVANDILTISAERKCENDEKDNNGNYIRCERTYGSFSRSFDVSSVKVDDISVRYENGVLALTLPKKESVIPASRHLAIE